MLLNVISTLFLLGILVPLTHLYVLALTSVRTRRFRFDQRPRNRFAIAIPAHDEESVIGQTIFALRQLDYPETLYEIHVIADHCADQTAERVRSLGVAVHERAEGPKGSKGAALNWFCQRILARGAQSPSHAAFDAVVIFDADTLVDPDFLRVMDAHLCRGDQVIQGQHCIRNAEDAWFPALTSAMFLIDNRFQNLGRSNLGWSAKQMGDSICFRADILRRLGWGEGLTEDYEFRQLLLLEGIKITYEPSAIGYGEAPMTWEIARAQRARWLNGTFRASQKHAWRMLKEGLRRRDGALLDGAGQALFPSYSTLTLACTIGLSANILLAALIAREVTYAWAAALTFLAAYPLIGLSLERAPLRTYVALLSGPVFIVWRTWLSIVARFGGPVGWVRTPRRGAQTSIVK